MSNERESQGPWYREFRQWFWLLAAVFIAAEGVFVVRQSVSTNRLESEITQATADMRSAAKRQQMLKEDLASYENLLGQNRDRKEQLIAEITGFQQQIALLKARTERLDRAHTELKQLDAALEKFRGAQDKLESHIRELVGALQKPGAA